MSSLTDAEELVRAGCVGGVVAVVLVVVELVIRVEAGEWLEAGACPVEGFERDARLKAFLKGLFE